MDNERVYSRNVWTGRGFRKRSVKESELTAEDVTYYLAELGKAYNAAPLVVKELFLDEAVPKMNEFRRKLREEGVTDALKSDAVAKALGGDNETVN
jgi:hypothetical protein